LRKLAGTIIATPLFARGSFDYRRDF